MDKAHGRDMLAIKNALVCFHAVTELISENMRFENGNDFKKNIDTLEQVQSLLERGISDEPSVLLNEGNLIKLGYNQELDSLRTLKDEGRKFLEAYLEEEKEATGITSLKIRYNRLIGYFFEVTKTQLSKVPKYFIRRQGIVGGERYSTDRLAALESDINGASEKLVELEKKLFLEIREETKKSLNQLTCAARCLAELDVAQSLAKAASVRNWTRPVLNESAKLEIYEGRHPVVEAHLSRGEYIPNDIILSSDAGSDEISFSMITGPNMAGKSTYLRSAALIVIMAQAGSFVPARDALIGLCDRIYCRVGASDNLARGESTFLVEMNETAYILNTATEKSLVIMDEVGRGTGTNDGLSIAWAVSEELLNRVGCRTLFATHFHELSLLSHPRLANRSMEVIDNDGKIVFLRKLKEGPAAESYGIHVAQLAGLSEQVLQRAWQIMELLKERDTDLTETFHSEKIIQHGETSVNQNKKQVNSENIPQHILKIKRLLDDVDPDKITPLEAINLICQWKKLSLIGIPQQKQAKPVKEENSNLSLFD
jgi:DNA mismatch repair protein MutS